MQNTNCDEMQNFTMILIILADRYSSGWFAALLVKNIGVVLICPKDIVLINFPQVGTSPISGAMIGGSLLLLKVIAPKASAEGLVF